MPITKSAAKRLRQSVKAAAKNVKIKRTIKTLAKKTRDTVAVSKDEAIKLFRQAQKAIDKAAQKGIITKNTAARRKSRLAKALAKTK